MMLIGCVREWRAAVSEDNVFTLCYMMLIGCVREWWAAVSEDNVFTLYVI